MSPRPLGRAVGAQRKVRDSGESRSDSNTVPDLVRRHRLEEVVALRGGAAQLGQGHPLLGGLHTLGDHPQPELAARPTVVRTIAAASGESAIP